MADSTSADKTSPAVCLVLGANGFIGSHLVDQLAANDQLHVKAFDRFSREPQFKGSQNVTILKGSLDDTAAVERAMEGTDYLIHSLSATTPFVADKDPYVDIHNLLKTVEIFDIAIRKKVRKIIFISSGGAVYGKSAEWGKADETTTPYPVSPYGICKLSIEHYLEYFNRKFGIDYVVYRLSNPYGPRQVVKQNQGVIPAFLHKIMHDEEVVIFGDGNMSRDYIYIEDAVAMIADTFMKPHQSAIYNIGSGKQTTLNEVVDTFKTALERQVRVLHQEAPKTFLQKADISIERFCEEFGHPNLTSFAEGLLQTVQYHNLNFKE